MFISIKMLSEVLATAGACGITVKGPGVVIPDEKSQSISTITAIDSCSVWESLLGHLPACQETKRHTLPG